MSGGGAVLGFVRFTYGLQNGSETQRKTNMRRRGKQIPASHVNLGAPATARKPANIARADVSAPSARANANPALSSEEVLCVVKNTLPESLSLRVSASRPGGKSFLQGADADLEPGGHLAFVGAIQDEVILGTEFGVFALSEVQGRPLFEPGDGLRQAAQRNPGGAGVPPWILTCQLASSSQRSRASTTKHQDFPALFSAEPALSCFRVVWAAKPPHLPDESTVFALENDTVVGEVADLLRVHGVGRFVLDGAVFFQSEHQTTIRAQDGTPLQVRAEGGSIVVEIPAHGDWPGIRLSGDRAPLRLAKRWQLCYRMQRVI